MGKNKYGVVIVSGGDSFCGAFGLTDARAKELQHKMWQMGLEKESKSETISEIIDFCENINEVIYTVYAFGQKTGEVEEKMELSKGLMKAMISGMAARMKGKQEGLTEESTKNKSKLPGLNFEDLIN